MWRHAPEPADVQSLGSSPLQYSPSILWHKNAEWKSCRKCPRWNWQGDHRHSWDSHSWDRPLSHDSPMLGIIFLLGLRCKSSQVIQITHWFGRYLAVRNSVEEVQSPKRNEDQAKNILAEDDEVTIDPAGIHIVGIGHLALENGQIRAKSLVTSYQYQTSTGTWVDVWSGTNFFKF